MPVAPASLSLIAGRVEARLTEVLDRESLRWGAVDPDLGALVDAIRQLVAAGGKRLRPAFCHWGFVGAGGDPAEDSWVAAGAAFELLHAFALFHDDVMDGSATRRGERTAHLVFADRHEGGGWSGEARRFGEGVAILIGDLAFVYADALLHDAPRAARELWAELRVELNVGQFLDILGTARADRDPTRARRVVRYKSAKYTVERPLHLGALLATGEHRAVELDRLSAYGLPLGDAFQLRDDILGVFGDSALTGKPVGDDLREGKPTPLMAIAAQRADGDQRQVLARVGDPELTAEEVAAIQAVLVATGAHQAIESEIDALVAEAFTALDALADAGFAPTAVDALGELTRYVAWRDA